MTDSRERDDEEEREAIEDLDLADDAVQDIRGGDAVYTQPAATSAKWQDVKLK